MHACGPFSPSAFIATTFVPTQSGRGDEPITKRSTLARKRHTSFDHYRKQPRFSYGEHRWHSKQAQPTQLHLFEPQQWFDYADHHHPAMRSINTLMLSSSASAELSVPSATTSDDFAPVLNLPALVSFLFITLVFVSLQVRVNAIGEAVDRRTRALTELRAIKAKELANDAVSDRRRDGDDSQASSSTSLHDEVVQAVERFREAYNEVERLRTIVPGVVRIRPPPSTNIQARMDETAAAAQQFLGIQPDDGRSRSNAVKEDTGNDNTPNVPLPFAILLGVVVFTQVGLFGLLLTDPTSSSGDMFNVVETINGLE